MIPPAGPRNSLADVDGLRVGHFDRRDEGYLSGTTVILAAEGGMVAGVDVRGGAPGTRETDLLAPTASIERIHAVVLTGGSAFGLSAACGVADALSTLGIGFPVGPPGEVVPLVPAAVLFDLGRGGRFAARPGPEFGKQAVAAAHTGTALPMGLVGAGVGAVSAGIKGGLGGASTMLPDGSVVAALVVANAAGSPVDPRTGELWGARYLLPEDFSDLELTDLTAPSQSDRSTLGNVVGAAALHLRTPASSGPQTSIGTNTSIATNTSIGIVATTATLSKAQCTKMAGTAHDGLARALNPVHTQFDGDTLFAVSTATAPMPDDVGLHQILAAAADVVTRALVRGLLASRSVHTSGGSWLSYLDLAPSARTIRTPAQGR